MLQMLPKLSKFLWLVVLTVWPSIFLVSAQEVVPDPIRLVFEDRMLTLNFQAQPQLLEREPMYIWSVGGREVPLAFEESLPGVMPELAIETRFRNIISRPRLEAFMTSTSWLQQADPTPVTISTNEQGYVWFKGRPRTGFEVDFDQLEYLLNEAINKGYDHVRVPAKKVYSPLEVSPELEARGIKEVLAVGESNFYGSSPERTQNIRVGANKFNGLIIKQGEQFSFNGILKSVDPSYGFVEELVIKGDDTEKELGGGVCQVSTTVYRAAFSGGFPIDVRRNHSYAVPYYKPHGLDATIYLGGQDFRFTNDTPGDILIQAFMEGSNLYFVFYGTSDGRSVAMEGPFISNYRPAPEPVIEETTALPAGEMAQLSEAHDGFNADWVRRVDYGNGEALEETFTSNYRAWPAKLLRGVTPEGELSDLETEDVPEDFFSLENSTFASTPNTETSQD